MEKLCIYFDKKNCLVDFFTNPGFKLGYNVRMHVVPSQVQLICNYVCIVDTKA
jgi:hypothetical protein